MRIDKRLEREPDFDNQIDIEEDFFIISLTKKEVTIECNWDYGYGSRGTEVIFISLEQLENLIKELKES